MTSKITIAQIRSIRDAFAEQLPSWEDVGKDTLIRHDGIVGQQLWFDRLRTGEYRPTLSLQVFVAPSSVGGTGATVEFLSIKRRQITMKSHEAMFNSVLKGLRKDITLPVDAPITPECVKTLIEKNAAPNLAESFCLACLSAYLGEPRQFEKWLKSFNTISTLINQISPERRAFLNSLEIQMTRGTAIETLRAVAKVELIKAGAINGS